MTENTATKSRNQAFLEQHERQRLSKLCNRTIDLRGKVAGECQAYQFGDKTHYLDDRGYLIAKQLLERFNGRYTFGVYETVLKALKQLSAKDESAAEKELEFILSRSKFEVQLIPFDRQLQRKESRIIFATPVDLRVADVLYHGATMDITSSAISIALKRVSTLNKGDQLSVSFPELASNPKLRLLTNMAYSVLAIEHDDLRTRLVLLRNRKDNDEVTQQLDLWCEHHNSPEYLDLDNELFNLACRYYQHLYCRTLTSPQFWLNLNNTQDPIKAFQLVPTSESTLDPFRKEGGDVDFSLLPFTEIVTEQSDLLLQISSQGVHVARRDDVSQMAALLDKHLLQESSHIFLLKTQKININSLDFGYEISKIAEDAPNYADNLEKRLSDIGAITSVTNLSSCCNMLAKSLEEGISSIVTPWQGKAIEPTDFKHTITREKSRYLIHTSIQMLAKNTKFKATTVDVSVSGLALNLPGDIALTLGSRVSIDFIRWQQQTSNVKLTKLTYLVRSCRSWDGTTHIGLERDKVSATSSVNQFFISAIKRSKAQLAKDNQDTIISQESNIFGALLGQYLATIPFYLGMDDDNKRILQAVISTNNAHENTFWLAFQNLVTMMSELLNSLPENTTDSIHLGIYCYQDNSGSWHIETDHEFSSINEKSVFINRALASEHHHFFHCRLCPVKYTWFDQETELNRQLLNLRNHSPHKVKQMKSIFLSFFAVGELTDITDIISANYQHIL
ncbi:MAG: PilZ domain-containing protein [Methylophaga sp.]|nr:PilZ domain-containing protein [Methylophaga sp.]